MAENRTTLQHSQESRNSKKKEEIRNSPGKEGKRKRRKRIGRLLHENGEKPKKKTARRAFGQKRREKREHPSFYTGRKRRLKVGGRSTDKEKYTIREREKKKRAATRQKGFSKRDLEEGERRAGAGFWNRGGKKKRGRDID